MVKRKDGGVERAGRWAREQSRYEQLQWLKDRWLRIAFFTMGFLAVSIALLAVKPHVVMGIVVGVLMTTWLWTLALLVLQETGTGSTLMGAEAEVLTAEHLNAMRRQGWRVLHAIPVDEFKRDLDHLAIGPAGVFGFETKWSRSDLLGGKDSWLLGRHVEQTRDRAAAFRMKRAAFGLREIPVTPVLVLWGPWVDRVPAADRIQQVDHVTVVAGPWLNEWANGLTSRILEPAAVQGAAEAVEGFLELREADFRGPDRGRFVSAGLYGVFADVRNGVLGALAGAFAAIFAAALPAGPSWLTFFVIAAAVAIVSWVVCFKTGRKPAVFGWALGATASLPLAGSWWLAGVIG